MEIKSLINVKSNRLIVNHLFQKVLISLINLFHCGWNTSIHVMFGDSSVLFFTLLVLNFRLSIYLQMWLGKRMNERRVSGISARKHKIIVLNAKTKRRHSFSYLRLSSL